ncbi:hypothetical protein, partial [Pseudomonas brassicae]|uniref:hypothetical protein n=1 Tax=Pseudomonas brassicae TaxID=2708063 RepID=UPI001FB332CE
FDHYLLNPLPTDEKSFQTFVVNLASEIEAKGSNLECAGFSVSETSVLWLATLWMRTRVLTLRSRYLAQ